MCSYIDSNEIKWYAVSDQAKLHAVTPTSNETIYLQTQSRWQGLSIYQDTLSRSQEMWIYQVFVQWQELSICQMFTYVIATILLQEVTHPTQ